MAITDFNKLSILFKKFFGKTQTAAVLEAGNEVIPSNLQLSAKTIFGESITTPAPNLQLWENNGIVQYVEFTVEVIPNSTNYAVTDTKYGELQNTAQNHGYILKLPSNYESLSSTFPFAKLGTGVFVNNSIVNQSAGALQLIPVSFHFGYEAKVLDSSNQEIPSSNAIDFYIDYYSGVLFVQDYDSNKIPAKVRAYIYIGKYANEAIASAGINNVSASTTNQVAFYNTATTVSGAQNFVYSGGNVGVGMTNPTAKIHVSSSNTLPGGSLSIVLVGNNNTERMGVYSSQDPVIYLGKTAGTIESPLAITNGTRLGTYQFAGHDGSNFVRQAWITSYATENWTNTSRGTSIAFSNTENGTTSIVDRMTISNDGKVTVLGNISSSLGVSGSTGVFTYLSGTNISSSAVTNLTTLTSSYVSSSNITGSYSGSVLAATLQGGHASSITVLRNNPNNPPYWGFITQDMIVSLITAQLNASYGPYEMGQTLTNPIFSLTVNNEKPSSGKLISSNGGMGTINLDSYFTGTPSSFPNTYSNITTTGYSYSGTNGAAQDSSTFTAQLTSSLSNTYTITAAKAFYWGRYMYWGSSATAPASITVNESFVKGLTTSTDGQKDLVGNGILGITYQKLFDEIVNKYVYVAFPTALGSVNGVKIKVGINGTPTDYSISSGDCVQKTTTQTVSLEASPGQQAINYTVLGVKFILTANTTDKMLYAYLY
jgi:hypothetical protein